MVSGSAVFNVKSNMKGKTMRLMILMILLWFPLLARAENPLPPVPEGGIITVMEGTCTDKVTNVRGYCVMSQDRQGNIYVIFAVDGEVKEIRQVVGNSYIVLWSATPGTPA